MTDAHLIDERRSACLCDIGGGGYLAAVAVAADGSEHLVVAEFESMGDETVRYDGSCAAVVHEQLGVLPLETALRLTINQRATRCGPDTIRCGRRTKLGRPCRARVLFEGDACAWHRINHHPRKELHQ
jgi:hypothetical protein